MASRGTALLNLLPNKLNKTRIAMKSGNVEIKNNSLSKKIPNDKIVEMFLSVFYK